MSTVLHAPPHAHPHTHVRIPRAAQKKARVLDVLEHHRFPRSSTSSTRAFFCAARGMRTCVWGCACGGACSTVDMGGGTICRASRDVVRATGWCAHALRWQSGGSSTDVRAAAHTALRVPRVCMSTRGWSTLVARAPGFQVHHRFPRSSTSSTRAFFCAARGMRTCVWGCACGGACSTVDMGGGTICRASRDVVRATGWCAHALRWQSGGSSTDVRAAAHTALRVPRVCMSTRGWSTLVARAPGFQVHHRFPRSSTSSTRAFFCGAKSFRVNIACVVRISKIFDGRDFRIFRLKFWNRE